MKDALSEVRPIGELKPWKDNPRSIDKQNYARLKEHIKRLGVYKPLIITEDGTVLGGNMRLRALKELGKTHVWVSVVKVKDESEMLEYALSDNDRMGSYDEEKLAELAVLHPVDLKMYHVELGKLTPLQTVVQRFGPEPEEDEPPEVDRSRKPASKQGEIYQLGRHRVMCGDSTDFGATSDLMDGKQADLYLTDPPYGVSYTDKNEFLNSIGGGDRLTNAIENDHQTPEEMFEFWVKVFTNAALVLKDTGSYYIFSPQGGDLLLLLLQAVRDSGFQLKHVLIWAKNNHVLGRADYNYKHEPIVYGWKQKGKHTFYGKGTQLTSLWEYDKPLKNDLHPTMKPIEVLVNALRNSTKEEDIVFDHFLGSGSTLIACEQTDRTCYGMELDPHYVDVIRRRYHKLMHETEEGWEAGTPAVK